MAFQNLSSVSHFRIAFEAALGIIKRQVSPLYRMMTNGINFVFLKMMLLNGIPVCYRSWNKSVDRFRFSPLPNLLPDLNQRLDGSPNIVLNPLDWWDFHRDWRKMIWYECSGATHRPRHLLGLRRYIRIKSFFSNPYENPISQEDLEQYWENRQDVDLDQEEDWDED